ncbi:hypothetical protein BKP45_04085 [Anaerobacillus alkalidiazotrophicus]|uniref:Replication-associated protein G2P N-terminal domain-containing protein n=1 Tax=Anaerobacillus alkalidiazotrophicus TaxID=472963 RepID=A0A1S2MDF7_9BACI|nr:phage/plasmid replication protein [Anaerobacillus alkalidiazotrophicus]OIJ21877.1 hypothetical protein BKP45_04085 [Anaerobacillus alkalidiazotrophicus]
MFDTVTLVAYDIDINPNQLEGIIPFTYLDNDDGSFISKYSFLKERINYKYNLQKKILEMQLSIPKMVYGTNTEMLTEIDISEFWIKLHTTLKEHFNIDVNIEQWKVKRLDISYNFKVDNVGAYISEINKKNLSKRTKITYNENETVIFKNKSSSICFYDKEKECINKKEPLNIIEQAKGILRLEIRPAIYHLREYSIDRKAVDLITNAFFTYIVVKFKINELLKCQEEHEDNDLLKALDKMKVADIEKVLGFNRLVEIVGEKTILEKNYYKNGTIRNRKELIAEYNKNIKQQSTKQQQLYITLEK